MRLWEGKRYDTAVDLKLFQAFAAIIDILKVRSFFIQYDGGMGFHSSSSAMVYFLNFT